MNYSTACGWLGVDPEEALDESSLRMAFRRAAIKEHPDKSSHENATERFQNVKRAHEFLEDCVERGETGRNADLDRTDEDEEPYHYHHEDEDDILEEFLAHIFFAKMMFGGGRGPSPFGGRGGRGGRGGGPSFMGPFMFHGGMPGMYAHDEDSDEDDYTSDEMVEIAAENNSTTVFPIPMDILRAFQRRGEEPS